MTIKNTILAIILLAILAIIAGLTLDSIKAEALRASLHLNRAAATSTSLPGRMVGLDNLEVKTPVLDRLDGLVALNDRALNVNVLELLEASASSLNG
jgi:hypothetical protein